MNDRYAAALERALFNWYHSGDGAPTEPVFNALKEGQTNDMQLLVPIDIPEALLRQLSSQENLQEGARFSIDEDMPISFKHIPVDEEGRYLIPLFTGEEQMELGESSSAISQPFGALLAAMDKWPDCVGFVINPYSDKIWVNEAIRDKIAGFEPKSHVSFVKGSVLDMKVSAIVNSAHRTLLGDSMVDEIIMDDADGAPVAEAYLCSGGLNGAVHKMAGPELFDECRTLGGCETGEAKVTGAYGIDNADYIIHTVGPVYGGEESDEEDSKLLERCYRNALDLAVEKKCDSVAFPCISAGAAGFPLGKSAMIAVITVVEWFEAHPDVVMNVYLCSFTENEYKNYLRMIKS